MRVISFNLNGIRAACRKGFCELLAGTAPDIVCLQEIKANLEDIPKLPSDYQLYWHPATRKGYSGVGIMTKRTPDQVVTGMGVNVYDAEGRVLRADYGSLSVVSVYVPSGSSGDARLAFKMRFLKAFKTYIRRLLAEGRELVLCGDFNIAHREIDVTNYKSNQKTSGFLPQERAWFDAALKLGLNDSYRDFVGADTPSYSWWSLRTGARARNVGWRLDYQVTTPGLSERVTAATIPREPVLSDHAPVIMDYDRDW